MKGTILANKSRAPSWKAVDLVMPELKKKVELQKLDIQIRTARAKIIEGSNAKTKGVALADILCEAGVL
jgi:hypothetical protein